MASARAREDVLATFRAAASSDGTIDTDKFQEILQACNEDFWTQQRIAALFVGAPGQGRGRVRVEEFLEWIFAAQWPKPRGMEEKEREALRQSKIFGDTPEEKARFSKAAAFYAENPQEPVLTVEAVKAKARNALGDIFLSEGPQEEGAEEGNEPLTCVAAAEAFERAPLPHDGVKHAGAKPQGKAGAVAGVQETQKQQRLADGIDLLTSKSAEDFAFGYSIHNCKLAVLVFTMDLSKSTNMGCTDWEDPHKVTKEILPLHTEEIGRVARLEPSAAAKLQLGFSWTYRPLDKAQIKEDLKEELEAMRAHAQRMKEKGIVESKLRAAAGAGSTADAIREACRAADELFLDVEFFPDDSALFENPDDPEHPPVVWKRAKDFIEPPYQVFAGDPKPNDIKQGALGDCWFLAALAALAEFPHLVRQLFVTPEYNDEGIYEIACFKNGIRTTVIVDDYFPCNPVTGRPCYSKVDGHEIWMLLLEKAWGKLHGCYERIEGGAPFRGIMDLCGGTGHSMSFKTKEGQAACDSGLMFASLKRFDEKGFLMCAGTPGHDDLTKGTGKLPTGGIVPGHAYTLLAAKQCGDLKLVRLRNPWGAFEWEGDWSDNSPLWTEEMKQVFKPALSATDGTFWMCDADFFREFEDVQIVSFSGLEGKDPVEHRDTLQLTGDAICTQVIQFQLELESTTYVTLIQQDHRMKGAEEYAELSFAVFRVDDAGNPTGMVMKSNLWPVRELVESTATVKDNAWVEEKLTVGKYILLVYNPQKVAGRSVHVVIQLDQHDAGTNQVLDAFVELTPQLRRATALIAASGGSAQKFGPLETRGSFLPNHSYAFAVRNPGKRAIRVTFDFSASTGFQVEGNAPGNMGVEQVCRPGEPLQLAAELVPVAERASFKVAGKMAYC